MIQTMRVNTKRKMDYIFNKLGKRAIMKLTTEYKGEDIMYMIVYKCL